jgi:uncharacterized phiE125 gp8 family phage protein
MINLRDDCGVLPVTLTEVKAYLRLDTDVDDDLLHGFVLSAAQMLEAYLSKTLMEKTWAVTAMPTVDGSPMRIELVFDPMIEIVSVMRLQPNGNKDPLKRYRVYPYTRRPIVACHSVQPVEVVYRAGYGRIPGQVPATLRQAILMLVAYFYENRTGEQEMPATVVTLVRPFADFRL